MPYKVLEHEIAFKDFLERRSNVNFGGVKLNKPITQERLRTNHILKILKELLKQPDNCSVYILRRKKNNYYQIRITNDLLDSIIEQEKSQRLKVILLNYFRGVDKILYSKKGEHIISLAKEIREFEKDILERWT